MFKSYFSADFILEKKALISEVLSDRSDGKTFDCKYRALRDYKENKHITIYLRRWKTEITQKMYNGFFNEVLEKEKGKEFRNWKFKYSKSEILVQTENNGKWDTILYFIPLTMSAKLKSQISCIERIHIIDFDEYIPLDNKYISNEMELLLEFWKSIDRDRDSTQLLILGNRITPFNPSFDYFGINTSITKDKIKLYKNNTIAIQIYSNKEHREAREKGRFRDMIRGTSYENYDEGGILNALNVKKKSHEGYNYMCSFKTSKGEGSIWLKDDKMVISEYCRNDGYVISDNIYNTGRKEYLCTYGRFPIAFKSTYRKGNMAFESEKAYYLFEDILMKCGSM